MKLFGTVDKTQTTKKKIERVNKDLQSVDLKRQVERNRFVEEKKVQLLEIDTLRAEITHTEELLARTRLEGLQAIEQDKRTNANELKALPAIQEEAIKAQKRLLELTQIVLLRVDEVQVILNNTEATYKLSSRLRENCEQELSHSQNLLQCARQADAVAQSEVAQISRIRQSLERELESVGLLKTKFVEEIVSQELEIDKKKAWIDEMIKAIEQEKKLLHSAKAKLKTQREQYAKN